MATIKIPYTYTSYPFSPKATKLSQRMAKGSMSWGVPAGIFIGIMALALLANLINSLGGDGMFALVLTFGGGIAAGVFSGIYLEKLRNKLYTNLIRKALEADLANMDPYQADYIRSNLAILKEK